MANNKTSQCVPDYLLNGFYMGYVVIPLCFVGMCLNILSIVTIRSNRKLHTNANMVIVSVAAADILLNLGYIGNLLLHFPSLNKRLLNAFIVDTVFLGVTYASVMLSVTQMGVIAVDRYIYIAHPFYYRKHFTNIYFYVIIVCFWLVAIPYAMLPMFVYTGSVYHQQCILRHPPKEYFYPLAVFYQITCVVIVYFYLKIAILAFRRKRASRPRHVTGNDVVNVNALPNNRSSAFKSVKFFAIVCGVYICFTSPGCLAILFSNTYYIPRFLYAFCMYFYFIHSIVNFFVFLNMNKDFLRGVEKTFVNVRKLCLSWKSVEDSRF